MLITGGMFLLGIVALIGAILLLSAEVRDQQVKVEAKPVTPSTSISLVVHPALDAGEQAAEKQELPLLLESGQVHSLADQLRQLHEQSKELEQRLATLNEMTARMSESQFEQ